MSQQKYLHTKSTQFVGVYEPKGEGRGDYPQVFSGFYRSYQQKRDFRSISRSRPHSFSKLLTPLVCNRKIVRYKMSAYKNSMNDLLLYGRAISNFSLSSQLHTFPIPYKITRYNFDLLEKLCLIRHKIGK